MRQAVAQIAAGDRDDEAEMRQNELTRRLHIAVIVEALRQPCFLGLREHRIAICCLYIGIDAADGRDRWESQCMGHNVFISLSIK